MTRPVFPFLLGGVLIAAVLAAFMVTGTMAACRRALPPPARRTARLHPPRATGIPVRAIRLAVAVLCAAALAVAGIQTAYLMKAEAQVATPAAAQQSIQQWAGTAAPPVSSASRARQVDAWYRLGGAYLLQHANAYFDQLNRAAPRTPDENVFPHLNRLRLPCQGLGWAAVWEHGYYFRIPDPLAQAQWQAFGDLAQRGSRDCERALDHQDVYLLAHTLLYEIWPAQEHLESATTRVQQIRRSAGY